MGGDTDLEAWMGTVANRVEFLELLDDQGPMAPRDIVEVVEYSRPTVTRVLKELREAGLVDQGADGYVTTLTGRLAGEEYRRHETAADAIRSAEDLLSSVPDDHGPPVDVLVGADVVATNPAVPVRALETVSGRVRDAESAQAYLPTLVDTHFLRVWHRAVVANSVGSVGIFDPELLTVLKGQYPHLLSEMGAADGFEAHAVDGPPYGIVLTTRGDETTMTVIVYDDETAVSGLLTNDSDPAVRWARSEIDRLVSDATNVTEDLTALSSSATDGLGRPTQPGSGVDGASGSEAAAAMDVSAGRSLSLDLEAEGFVSLTTDFFDTHGLAPPEISWRTGFTLPEVNAGHHLDRHDVDGRSFTDKLVESLRDRTDHVVLGPPGSGKSTICMSVACSWFDSDIGPVIYRERGTGDSFESAALLEATLRQTDGHALVVVEDAVRDEANAIFDVMQALDADRSVTFLLDSRTREWQQPDAFDIDARRDAYRRATVEECIVPAIGEQECERFVTHFEELVDTNLDMSGAELFTLLNERPVKDSEERLSAGHALIVQHHLARRMVPLDTNAKPSQTALEETVRQSYRRVSDAVSPIGPDLAVMVAVLTAAGIPVAPEYLYAVTAEDAAFEEALADLEGRLLFEPAGDGPRSTTYRTRHETWALRFLEGVLDIEPTDRARERFGRCVTRLLTLADDPERRTRIERHLDGRTPHLHRIEADPRGWADELVDRIFGVGRTDATLAPLFGETGDGTIELPAACSSWTRLQQAYWRGEMNRTQGDLARAEREFRKLGELAADLALSAHPAEVSVPPQFTSSHEGDEDLAIHRTRWRATSCSNLGTVARDRGRYETAEEYYMQALAFFREIGDREGEALSLKDLGGITYLQSDYEQAQAYLEQSLSILRDLDARMIEAQCLNNLGILAQDRNEYDHAREYHEQSLTIKRDLSDTQGEANSLDNLGLAVQRQGEYGVAREYHERSLELKRELGDRKGEATSLNNLGRIARRTGDADLAREYFERSLEIRRSLGDSRGEAHSLIDLGAVARQRGEYDVAGKYVSRALDLFERIGNEFGLARGRLTAGRLALARGEIDVAREHARAARTAFEELGSPHWVGRSRHLLGEVAAANDAPDEAREHWRAAVETFETLTTPQDALATLEMLIDTCRAVGDVTQAREWCRRAHEMLTDAPDSTAEIHRTQLERHTSELGFEVSERP